MEIRPILSALLRNRTGAILVGLQIAITLAVVANAFFIISQRIERIAVPSGVDSDNLVFVRSYGYAPGYDHAATVRGDLALLRGLPGVVGATPVGAIPLSGSGSASVYRTTQEQVQGAPRHPAAYFEVDEQGLDTLGLRLVEGRNFRAEEITVATFDSFPQQVILSRAYAESLFAGERALGRLVYSANGKAAEVVGIVEHMLHAWPHAERPPPDHVVLHPMIGEGPTATYAVRAAPGERDRLVAELEQRLGASGHGRVIVWTRPHAYFVERVYRSDRRMVVFLSTLVGLMTAVTALGIVGLATFHVNARRKQIGTRRAVGARRIDIVRYFLVENGLLAAAGVVVGGLLAYVFSWWLSSSFELPALRPAYVLATAVALVALGQLAVLWPARRAAAIPPAVATRTV